MKTKEFEDKDMVSKCCCSDMLEPDWEMAENSGSMWRAYSCYVCHKCNKACTPIERINFKEVLEFIPTNLSHIFKNINHKPCNEVSGYDLAWDIRESSKTVGELFYSNEFREWFFIKDNYPMPRKGYRLSFPIKNKELFIELFKGINIELIINT